MSGKKAVIQFNDEIVRKFVWATVIWSLVGLSAGLLVALQLNFWEMNGKFLEKITFGLIKTEGIEFLTFGRLRPLHTNAAIFAFVGNMMFAGIYYSTQRLCKVRMASDLLSKIHFWGWQFIIVCAAVTLPLGLTRSKEYAELIWPINLMVAVIWLVFGWNFFWTLKNRNEPSLYVAIWFYIATIITVTMLYVVNHLQIPTSLTHSYPVFGGVQDALVQWWYGHNAVAFFLTTPILGIMYYFLPKAAERPVYSYRLSVIHFWSLVFLYIWAGPHHLLNTALPNWLQAMGMLFSLMLWAPSWGGMLNGLLTLRGAWHKLRTDPVIKFFVAGVTFYGMATFEGPLLSIRAVNALSHFSDWTIGHVHSGTLGWNGFMAAGMVYWLAPRLWKTKLYSVPLANMHFWIGLVGILFYVAAMWVSGISQGLMLNATESGGTVLAYSNFVETLDKIRPLMLFRAMGGGLYLVGFFLMAWNFYKTVRSGQPHDASIETMVWKEVPEGKTSMGLIETLTASPMGFFAQAIVYCSLWFFLPPWSDWVALLCLGGISVWACKHFLSHREEWIGWHDKLLENWMPFSALAFISVAVGGLIQIVPTVTVNRAKNIEDRLSKLYTPLELAGRDIYVSEGCYNCHSQMVRTMVPDVLRYGDYSRLGESIYDHPFLWGSKRTGPDLARVGGKYSHAWHFNHMMNPRQLATGSNMPNYPWLAQKETDIKALPRKIAVQRRLGVPYDALTRHEIEQGALEQGIAIAKGLKSEGVFVEPDKQIVALIAYLQKLGDYEDLQLEEGEEAVPAAPAPAPAPEVAMPASAAPVTPEPPQS